MKKIIRFCLLLFTISISAQSQIQLSPQATFSVITCGSGEELYSTFGHSAFRLQDPVNGYDVVYNYGTFDFSTSLFYLKFAQGKLPYQLGRSSFDHFLRVYKYENRWVKEQVLRLTPEQTRELLNFLEQNYLPENRSYPYDFFYNNCATKIRDVLVDNVTNDFIFHEDHLSKTDTFRDLLHEKLHDNTWSKFGIDLALGAVIDEPVKVNEYQFLPEYVFKAFENATLYDGTTPLVLKTQTILQEANTEDTTTFSIFSPYVVFTLIALIIIIFTILDYRKKTRSRWLDFSILFVGGIAGLILSLLWFATEHSATKTNLNILWLFPINIVFAFKFFSRKQPKTLYKYTFMLLALIALVVIAWLTGFQIFPLAAIPLLIAFTIRYVYLVSFFRKLS